MREGSVRVLSGEVDITDVVLAKVKPRSPEMLAQFLHDRMGYTESRLKELFGDEVVLSPESQ